MYHNLNEWGLGMPLEVQVENHLCGKFKDTFLNDGSLFASVTFCSPTNSQEKHAEDFIEIKKYCADKRLQQNVGRHYAKLEANRVEGVRIYNEETNEYEFKYKEYTYEQIVAEDIQSIKYYNNMKHRHKAMYPNVSIRDAFFANINPKVGTMDNHRVSYWLGQPVNTSIDRHQYVNLQYQKYWLEDLHLIERLAPGNYNVIAYFMRDRNGVPYPEAYIYQNNKYIGRVCTFEKVQTAKAEWEDADTEAKRAQKDYMERFGKYIQEGKGELMPLRYSNINRTVNQLNEDRQAYIVAPAQVEEAESEPRYDFDEQSALEYAREQALTF
jgi:hypothetical protein